MDVRSYACVAPALMSQNEARRPILEIFVSEIQSGTGRGVVHHHRGTPSTTPPHTPTDTQWEVPRRGPVHALF